MPTPQVVFQIVPSLAVGGAERLVVHLVAHLSRERFAPVCICLESPLGTHYEARVRASGAPLYFLGKGARASGSVLRQLNALFRQYRPAVVHTHIIGLNYAYPLMLRYHTPARVHTVHSLARSATGDGRGGATHASRTSTSATRCASMRNSMRVSYAGWYNPIERTGGFSLMQRAVVTGGAGFIGSHLVDRLIAEGWQVVVVDNLITGRKENLQHLMGCPNFEFIQHDVCEPFDVEGAVDYVFHLASTASPVDFVRHPLETLRVGSYGTENALELAMRKGARFLFSSTSEVYGDPLVHPQPEDYWGNVNPIGVRGVYDEAKRYAESLVMAYHRYKGLDTRIVRIFNTYGERMRLDDGRVVPNFVCQALRGEPITVYGDGSQTRSFGYVSDLIEGIWRLAHADYRLPVNIGNPEERTILEFAQIIKQLTGSDSPIVFQEFLTPDDPKQRCPDITRAREILGWAPRVSLEEGLRRTIDYFNARL